MPLYDLHCASCSNEFEALARNTQLEGVKCPNCGGAKLSRLISRFAMASGVSPCGSAPADRAPG